MDEQTKKVLKKRLGEGMIIPAGDGVITAIPMDAKEYTESKSVRGFVYQMPITIHVRAGGTGAYEEFINKYMSLEDAEVFHTILGMAIAKVRSYDMESSQ